MKKLILIVVMLFTVSCDHMSHKRMYGSYFDCMERRDYQCSVEILKRIISKYPDDDSAKYYLAKSYYLSRDLKLVKALVEERLEHNRFDIRWYVLMIDAGVLLDPSYAHLGVQRGRNAFMDMHVPIGPGNRFSSTEVQFYIKAFDFLAGKDFLAACKVVGEGLLRNHSRKLFARDDFCVDQKHRGASSKESSELFERIYQDI